MTICQGKEDMHGDLKQVELSISHGSIGSNWLLSFFSIRLSVVLGF